MSKPEHYTSIGTRKFQCNGPQDWSQTFKELAAAIAGKGAPEGIGIRAVLAAGVKAAKASGGVASVAKLGEHIEAELAKERSELAVKLAKKAPAKAKAKKAAKVAKAKAKNAKKELPS